MWEVLVATDKGSSLQGRGRAVRLSDLSDDL